MLSEFRTLSKIILCAMLMNPMYLLYHLIPFSDLKQWDKMMAHKFVQVSYAVLKLFCVVCLFALVPFFLQMVSSFPKIFYCSLLACWPAFGRRPPSPKILYCSLLAGWPAFGRCSPSPKILYCSLLACWPAFGQRPPSPKIL